jgi:hypothetical protein
MNNTKNNNSNLCINKTQSGFSIGIVVLALILMISVGGFFVIVNPNPKESPIKGNKVNIEASGLIAQASAIQAASSALQQNYVGSNTFDSARFGIKDGLFSVEFNNPIQVYTENYKLPKPVLENKIVQRDWLIAYSGTVAYAISPKVSVAVCNAFNSLLGLDLEAYVLAGAGVQDFISNSTTTANGVTYYSLNFNAITTGLPNAIRAQTKACLCSYKSFGSGVLNPNQAICRTQIQIKF